MAEEKQINQTNTTGAEAFGIDASMVYKVLPHVAKALTQGAAAVLNIWVNGNKEEMHKYEANVDLNVACTLHLKGGVIAYGQHLGPRTKRVVSHKCFGCLVPVYAIEAHGKGSFLGKTTDGRLIEYHGSFQNHVFNDVNDTEPATFHFDGEFKYEGSFKHGHYHGKGKLTKFLDDASRFLYQDGRYVDGAFYSGKQYIQGKPRFYREYKNGMESEEKKDPGQDTTGETVNPKRQPVPDTPVERVNPEIDIKPHGQPVPNTPTPEGKTGRIISFGNVQFGNIGGNVIQGDQVSTYNQNR